MLRIGLLLLNVWTTLGCERGKNVWREATFRTQWKKCGSLTKEENWGWGKCSSCVGLSFRFVGWLLIAFLLVIVVDDCGRSVSRRLSCWFSACAVQVRAILRCVPWIWTITRFSSCRTRLPPAKVDPRTIKLPRLSSCPPYWTGRQGSWAAMKLRFRTKR